MSAAPRIGLDVRPNGTSPFLLALTPQQALAYRIALQTQFPRDPVARLLVAVLEALDRGPVVVKLEQLRNG